MHTAGRDKGDCCSGVARPMLTDERISPHNCWLVAKVPYRLHQLLSPANRLVWNHNSADPDQNRKVKPPCLWFRV